VDTYTGNFTYAHTDTAINGRGPAPTFASFYNSSDTIVGVMGMGWKHNYEARLVRPDATTEDIVVIGLQSHADRYTHNADGSYTAPAGISSKLVKNSNGTYTVTDKNQSMLSFDESGRLLRITDRYGNQSIFSYDASGKLIAVGDPAGRGALTFSYNANSKLSSVLDWASRTRAIAFGIYEIRAFYVL